MSDGEDIMKTQDYAWKIIETYFRDNPQCLVRHHIDSYNDFFKKGIYQIFRDKNPVRIVSQYDNKIDDYICSCNLYMGGKDGTNIYIGKPVIYDDNDRSHYMFPNEARLRNMTYAVTIHYDVEVEFTRILREGDELYPVGVEEVLGGNSNEYYDSDSDSDSDNDNNSYSYSGNNPTQNVEYKGGAPKKNPFTKAKNTAPTKKAVSKNPQMTPSEFAMIRQLTEGSLVKQETQNASSLRKQVYTKVLKNIYLGKFPIMVQSELCILNSLPREVRFQMGECRNDPGGYFIIDGKEKVVIPQEKFADNMLAVRKSTDDHFLYSADIRSVSENLAKPVRTLSVKIVAPSGKHTNRNIVVNIPNVRKPVPLFIVFRALGILSDKEIITMCMHDLDKYADLIELFVPSVHESGGVMSQIAALRFIAILTKHKSAAYVHEILSDYFLPHIGETNYIQKAYYLGYMVFRLILVSQGIEIETNRDNYKYKRIDTTGVLISELFREYFKIQQNSVRLQFDRILNYNKNIYEDNLDALIMKNYEDVFKQREVDAGVRKAFKGNWGAYAHTKRIGVVQDLNRLSYFSTMNHLRKTVLNLDSGVKLVGPRVLHASQWGFFDPIDSPDGSNIGLHKHLSICTYITKSMSREPVVQWLRENIRMRVLEECPHKLLARMTKVIVNGLWAGVVDNPFVCLEKIRLFRRNALLPIYLSASFEISQNTIYIYCDEGRLTRPIFYFDKDTGKFSFENSAKLKTDSVDKIRWTDLISGFNEKADEQFHVDNMQIYTLNELYSGTDGEKNPAKMERFIKNKCAVEYLDASESETMLIAVNDSVLDGTSNGAIDKENDNRVKKYTHIEIHESFIFSMLCNMVNYLENNPATRNNFSCGQTKQAVSMYHTNHQVRMDKAAVVLNSGQIPLVKSRYLEYINHEGNPYGENAIVAIMCYTGYNVEDAVLINEGALKRGLFHTTYYSTYETYEEKGKSENGEMATEKIFANIENLLSNGTKVNGKRLGFEYDQLDEYGLVKEGTEIHDKVALIGMTSGVSGMSIERFDESVNSKKGQLGIVDKTFITEGEEGQRIAKVRVREIRIPALGDKMASRAGQKGTVGMIIPECDMPFTKDGLRPDIIINPHALPTRMTIGQLVECISAKAVALQGGFADCTAFTNHSKENIGKFGELLTSLGYHSSGNQVMYNGMTGEQIDSEIFVGPTYYMRLKHMVKDKVNYRTTGPRTALTRQTVGGRANDGGLRIGEMERDAVISHGATNFLTESMMERGDKYYMAVCNKTGMISVYNSSRNLFFSPMADGPIKYTGSLNDSEKMRVMNITKFGRSFSIICIPYSLKLLIQELQCMNITMRILTEDNINQMENLTFSNNIEKLTQRSVGNITEILIDIRTALYNEQASKMKKYAKEVSPEIVPTTPEYVPTTPEYVPTTPEYVPTTPSLESEEKPYIPISREPSPAYARDSPAYAQDGGVNSIFKINDIVSIRQDGGKNNKWRVNNIGEKFITVENMYPTSDRDTIKIVEPYNIFHATHISPKLQMPTEYDLMQQHQQQQQHQYQLNNDEQSLLNMNPMSYPQGGIQINPTFVIGDNNKLPSGTNEKSMKGGNVDGDTIDAAEFKNTPTVGFKIKETGGEKIEKENTKEKTPSSSNSFFDFLKINKIMS